MTPRPRALVSTFDKRDVDSFSRGLLDLGFEIVSTGGTARALTDAGVEVTPVSEITGFPEVMDGRVKTLHPVIHAGILADRDRRRHQEDLERHSAAPIDVVAVNLYPFSETVASGGSESECVEMIDIGGPAMIRAAAKNHAWVWVIVDPGDYDRVLEALAQEDPGSAGLLRRELAAKAFQHTAVYDRQIAAWMSTAGNETESELPAALRLDLTRHAELRYGENPHQAGALYRFEGEPLLGGFRQLQGKQLSYNNLLDLDAARALAAGFEDAAVVIVKHNNPCGVAIGADLPQAYSRALACDPTSAFGSVIGVNRPVDAPLAEIMADLFVEVVAAPGFSARALDLMARKRNLRLIEAPVERPRGIEFRSVDGGMLAQQRDSARDQPRGWSVVSERHPDDREMPALALAWSVCRAVRSNAIVIANPTQTVGIGAGQMSRVDACRIAVDKAVLNVKSTAAASDAFFPFADGVEVLARAGVTAVVQPGGSRRDQEVIAAADQLGIAMLTTGRRHFRH